MNKNDFRYFRRGKQLYDLKEGDYELIKPVFQYGVKNERALLLLHGFSSSPAVFRYLIPQLHNYDAIVCPTLPGHGESIAALSQATAENWLTYAKKTAEELFKKYNKVDVLGFSLGGLLACKLGEHFAFNHLYLLAPALKLCMNVPANLKLATVLHHLGFKEIRGAAGNLLSDEQAEISYRRLPLTAVIQMFHLILNHQWVAPTVPVDIFLGTHDAVVSSPQIEELFRNLDNVSIHWLENSAHVLPLDNDLSQLIKCINQNMD
jgi:carboxylesterase